MDILATIRKLLAYEISERKIGNAHAAEAFAEKIRSLLAKYNVSLDDIPADDECQTIKDAVVEPKVYDYEDEGRRVPWIEMLASGVAKGHYCRLIVFPQSSAVCFVGRAHDREVAAYTFTILARAALKSARGTPNLYSFTEGFTGDSLQAYLLGFASRINERYKELVAQDQESSTGLILSRQKIDDYCDERWQNEGDGLKVNVISPFAFIAGDWRARREDLNKRGVEEGKQGLIH
jgi:hypothetical protein